MRKPIGWEHFPRGGVSYIKFIFMNESSRIRTINGKSGINYETLVQSIESFHRKIITASKFESIHNSPNQPIKLPFCFHQIIQWTLRDRNWFDPDSWDDKIKWLSSFNPKMFLIIIIIIFLLSGRLVVLFDDVQPFDALTCVRTSVRYLNGIYSSAETRLRHCKPLNSCCVCNLCSACVRSSLKRFTFLTFLFCLGFHQNWVIAAIPKHWKYSVWLFVSIHGNHFHSDA